MIHSYWELYVAYVAKCVRDNWINDIDPHHYEMEWNHALPQCLFGDWTVGQYLTLKQHAIASALQTLAFKKNCMFGWHKRYLPERLVGLAWPHFEKQCEDNGKKTYTTNFGPHRSANGKKNTGAMNGHPNTAANRSATGRKNGLANGGQNRKCILLTDTATGETFEFPSGCEAAVVLGLDKNNLRSVARGKRKTHKGYTAVYLPTLD